MGMHSADKNLVQSGSRCKRTQNFLVRGGERAPAVWIEAANVRWLHAARIAPNRWRRAVGADAGERRACRNCGGSLGCLARVWTRETVYRSVSVWRGTATRDV